MTVTITGTVEQTRNPKYQKIATPGMPVYSVGLQDQAALVGKTVTVTIIAE
jgi:hypothetical protein